MNMIIHDIRKVSERLEWQIVHIVEKRIFTDCQRFSSRKDAESALPEIIIDFEDYIRKEYHEKPVF